MKIGIPKEIHEGERRVAATPDTAKKLQKLGFTVLVETNAGEEASFPDQAYRDAGCEIVTDVARLWGEVDIVAKVRPPEMHPGTGLDEVERSRRSGRFEEGARRSTEKHGGARRGQKQRQ